MAESADSAMLVDAPPDIMNDYQFDTNPRGDDGTFDIDTCRICRGEGSDAEPLFHPCKCNGSIKHVHQDCLMEWLSHSQKKHCELCKTPFRFTKLYSPNMPQSLPPAVFLRHFVLHSLRNVTTWLRFCLVVTVWLGILPYIIRQVWRFLFWFSDGGWPSQSLMIDSNRNMTAFQALEAAQKLQLASTSTNGTSPATPFSAAQTSPASVGGLIETLAGFLVPFSQRLNISGADPLAAGLFKSIYYGLGLQNAAIPEAPASNTSVSQFIMNMAPAARSPSLLSDIKFLRNLTRYSYVNQLCITIAEGYIITTVVVVAFILVFLIREWVVQQQPNINMGAAFNADFVRPDADLPREVAAIGNQQNAEPAQARDDEIDRPLDDEATERVIARPRGRRDPPLDDDGNPFEIGESAGLARPTAVRDALTPAAEIQKQLTEEPRMTEEFLAMWRLADSDPEEVLRMIERENKVDDMRYWVNAMNSLRHPLPHESQGQRSGSLNSVPAPSHPSSASSKPSNNGSSDSLVTHTGSDQDSASGESWTHVPKPLGVRNANINQSSAFLEERDASMSSFSEGKGKAKESEQSEPLFDPTGGLLPGVSSGSGADLGASPLLSLSSSTRPRAISDGPQLRGSMSPLASNNWSFKNIPGNDENLDPNYRPSETQASKFNLGDSESTTSNIFASPSKPVDDKITEAWKTAQNLRVQQAIAKGREAHRSALESQMPARDQQTEREGPVEVRGQDGVLRTAANWDEVFANNPVDSDTDDQPEENPFAPDNPLPPAREPIVDPQIEPQGFIGNVIEWLWGGVGIDPRQDEGANDEHIVEDLAAEAPFVPVANRDALDAADNFGDQDREVVEAAIAAGIDPNDPDAIDDAEDFEGIMELVGMRGPISNLIQNAIFSACLLALTVAFGVWIPYQIGRVSLLLTANPGPALKLPLRLVYWLASFLQDTVVAVLGIMAYLLLGLIAILVGFWDSAVGTRTDIGMKWAYASLRLSHEAIDRIKEDTINSLLNFTDSEIFAFSAASHESLLTIKYLITDTLEDIGSSVRYLFEGDYTRFNAWTSFSGLVQLCCHTVAGLPAFLMRPDSWMIGLDSAKRATPLDLELSIWGAADRTLATLAGYTALSILGAMYVKKGSPFSNGQVGREWEATIIDLLNQAGGVMKVILIISIEMLVFPLYCGLLLDAALLPLFENATLMSRILFTIKSPCTSIFVHWFVGTCYMFHFALFVSMCRKIMRKGVLYFIRDPDDPTFHPVRDVLERNVATQLRKILFSALVYGALVVICLGGVVWGLSWAFRGVLPIHWSSNEPVLEFPIDLLFYNFLMPLAVKFFKPSDGLHAMYSWWFRRCARMLRLTWFMFDERQPDEEGYIVRRSWKDILQGLYGDALPSMNVEDPSLPFKDDPSLDAFIMRDGRYVRAPASDQVRVKKGAPIFLQVDEFNNRLDKDANRPAGEADWDSDLYKQVYVPPHFRLRITAFIISIWIFAALTGVCITIVPLVFGREVFSMIIPANVRKNDVYAFSIGIYILGSALYIILHVRQFFTYLADSLSLTADTPRNAYRIASNIVLRIAKITWSYSAVLFLLPTLCAFLTEFYAIVPLHTYFSPAEPHTIHFVQSWTLGLLYVKLTTRLIQFYPDSRAAASLRLIVRDGYLNPDAGLATRAFILPAAVALLTALFWPWALARLAVLTVFKTIPQHDKILVYRYAYPAVLLGLAVGYLIYLLCRAVRGWRMRIRDEVYLIGERLHNFGERKSGPAPGIGVRRIET